MLIIQQLIPQMAIISISFSKKTEEIQWIAIGFSQIAMMHSQLLVNIFPGTDSIFQYQFYGKQGQDGISLWQVWQISILIPIIQQSTWNTGHNQDAYKVLIILQQLITFWSYAVFMVQDLQLFYISFEGIQIPMYFIIGFYGGRNRKIHAANQFFIYTLLGSQFQLQAQIILYYETGTSDYQIIQTRPININHQYLLWQAFFFALAIKIPMIPVHIWLPEAHVEAPTAASIIQAAILQKQGSYGLLRYCLHLFPIASTTFTPYVATMCIIGIIYSSFACLALWDMKKLIAYSSIGHMNTATLALFTNDLNGLNAGIFFLISHGIISSALFILIGILYDRFHTRTIKYFRGQVNIMPLFTLFFLIFTLSNIAVPGTSGFVCEFLTFLAAFNLNPFIGFISSIAIVLAPAYSLWFLHKISYGSLSPHFTSLWTDLTLKEFHMLLPLAFFAIFLGLYPTFIFSNLEITTFSMLSL